jgi:hypothetical protein
MVWAMSEKFFEIGGNKNHKVGDKRCPECFGSAWPVPCKCGGEIHSEFGDENSDGDYWLYTACDQCGEPDPTY